MFDFFFDLAQWSEDFFALGKKWKDKKKKKWILLGSTLFLVIVALLMILDLSDWIKDNQL